MAAANQLNLNALTAYRNPPRFSFQGRPPAKEHQKGNPFPGGASLVDTTKNKYANAPRWSISGLEKDDGKGASANPGPDKYNPPEMRYTAPPRWGFGSEPRLREVKQAKGPGPGDYEVRGGMEGLQKSFSSRPEGGSTRSKTPGPTDYKPNADPLTASSPKFSFGSSSRKNETKKERLGPGTYEVMPTLGGNAVMRTSQRYSFKGRYASMKVTATPGPPAAGTTFR